MAFPRKLHAVCHSMVAWLVTDLGLLLKFASAVVCTQLLAAGTEKSVSIRSKKVLCQAAEVFLLLTVMVCSHPD